MTLTADDKNTIKSLLSELREDIAEDTDRKMGGRKLFEETAQTRRIREEIRATEDNLKKKITDDIAGLKTEINQKFKAVDKRFDNVDKVLSDLVEVTTKNNFQMYSNHENRIKALETNRSV